LEQQFCPPKAVFGFRSIELSWILEDNLPMRRVLERLGARAYKTYRIYGKKLAASAMRWPPRQ